MSAFRLVLNEREREMQTKFGLQVMILLVLCSGNACKCICTQLNDGNYTILKKQFS